MVTCFRWNGGYKCQIGWWLKVIGGMVVTSFRLGRIVATCLRWNGGYKCQIGGYKFQVR